jgi:hypothetical protein
MPISAAAAENFQFILIPRRRLKLFQDVFEEISEFREIFE